MTIDLKLLAQYDTPTISNAVYLLKNRPRTEGYMDERIRACFPERRAVVAYAATDERLHGCAHPRLLPRNAGRGGLCRHRNHALRLSPARWRRLRLARRTGGPLCGVAGSAHRRVPGPRRPASRRHLRGNHV